MDQLIKTKNPDRRRDLVKNVEDCVINAISELADNCLQGNIPLNKCQFKRLAKFKNILRRLRKQTSVRTRRNILNQHGGFLQFLIAPALTFIASILASYVEKKMNERNN